MDKTEHACTPPDDSATCSGIRVLLVEDNPINCKVMARYCQRLGCDVVMAANGVEALRRIEEGTFDIVLTDIHMPDMDGMELTRAIREHENGSVRNIPVLVISSSSDPEDFIRYRDVGADGSIPKPFEMEDLQHALDIHAKGHTPPDVAPRSNGRGDAHDMPLGTLPVFDEETARRYTLQNEVFLRKLLREFVGSFPGQLAQMRDAIDAVNLDGLQTIAHRCKGASGSIAASQIFEICVRLERACRNNQAERAGALFSELGEAGDRFRQHLGTQGWIDGT